jgi:hypothetical protein
MPATVHPITEHDTARVDAFLREHLNPRVDWEASMRVPWTVDAPNGGFMLLDDDTVVGAHLAFYSVRTIDGRPEKFCNLAAWCVLPEHRFQGMRLLKALLAQEGYHFTDLSPSGNVVPLNRRMGFQVLDTRTALVPNLPWPSLPGRCRISADPAVIERTLTGPDLELYRDHRGTNAARHAVLIRGEEWCYVVFRKDRRKNLPLFASILYVSHPDVFRRFARPFGRHLLLHHGAAASLTEQRVVEHRPRWSYGLRSPRQKMFRSARLEPAQIDYFYSELVCVAW